MSGPEEIGSKIGDSSQWLIEVIKVHNRKQFYISGFIFIS